MCCTGLGHSAFVSFSGIDIVRLFVCVCVVGGWLLVCVCARAGGRGWEEVGGGLCPSKTAGLAMPLSGFRRVWPDELRPELMFWMCSELVRVRS